MLTGIVLLQRILQVEYEFPPHVKVSKECRDLLHRILVPDPAKRITVPEIQNHVWYKKDLPPGVAEMNDNLPPPGAGLQVISFCCGCSPVDGRLKHDSNGSNSNYVLASCR